MKIPPITHRRAFTMVEALVVTLVIALLLALFLPTLNRPQRRSSRIGCVNYLKQIGIAVRVWQGDNNDKYPMNVPAALGGAQEMMATGNVVLCFQVMSNELATPKYWLARRIDTTLTPLTLATALPRPTLAILWPWMYRRPTRKSFSAATTT